MYVNFVVYVFFFLLDKDECSDPGSNPCYGICINTIGAYNCTCKPGSSGNAYILNGCKEDAAKISKSSSTIIIIGNSPMQV